jgi:hypothetical protein
LSQQGGFANAAGAEHGDMVSAINGEVYIAQYHLRTMTELLAFESADNVVAICRSGTIYCAH